MASRSSKPLDVPGPVPVALARPWSQDADGVYRAALADGRGVWVWRSEPGCWRYGMVSGTEDVPNTFMAPSRVLAKEDCLMVASWLRPGARPVFEDGAECGRQFHVQPVSGEGAERHNPLTVTELLAEYRRIRGLALARRRKVAAWLSGRAPDPGDRVFETVSRQAWQERDMAIAARRALTDALRSSGYAAT